MARASFGPTLALVVTLALAAFALVMPVPHLLIERVDLPAPLPSQNQRAESVSYLLAFLVILPLALAAGRRIADRIAAGPNGAALPALTGLLAAALAAAILAVRLSGALGLGDGVAAVLVAAVVWWVGAAALLWRAAQPPEWALAPSAPAAWGAAGLLLLGALLSLTDLSSVSPIGLALGALAAAAAFAARDRPGRASGRLGAALDALAVALILLAVPDLVIFRPEDAAADARAAIESGIFQFHHNLLLGPANEVLHGRALLDGAASQYGVGNIYVLVAWFQVAPIGYGTLGLLTGVMTALWYAAGYGVVRLGGASRPVAAAALALAVVALAYNLIFPVGALPQSGPLRFGPPMAVLLAIVAGARFPAHARAARAAALVVVGIAAVWSLEGLAYTLAVYAAAYAAQEWLAPAQGRARRLVRHARDAALAFVAAHVLFALANLVAAGSLPAWGDYLVFLREFLLGEVGELTYDVDRWSPVLALGAAYLASAAAVVELIRRGGALAERERATLIALAGTTAYAIALLSYFVDRSQSHILQHVALPGVMAGALWLALLLRARAEIPGRARAGGLATALAAGVLVLAVAWSSLDDRIPDTALAHAAPRTLSIRDALERLWQMPPFNPAAPDGERVLARHMPGERESLLMVAPDLQIELLMRTGRVDRLHLGDAWESSFIVEHELPRLRAEVDALRPGTRMLMDGQARDYLERLRADPELNPLGRGEAPLATLQRWALQRIERRFDLEEVAAAGDFTVVELGPRG